jgi:hypothetical protein
MTLTWWLMRRMRRDLMRWMSCSGSKRSMRGIRRGRYFSNDMSSLGVNSCKLLCRRISRLYRRRWETRKQARRMVNAQMPPWRVGQAQARAALSAALVMDHHLLIHRKTRRRKPSLQSRKSHHQVSRQHKTKSSYQRLFKSSSLELESEKSYATRSSLTLWGTLSCVLSHRWTRIECARWWVIPSRRKPTSSILDSTRMASRASRFRPRSS